jgi:hypothetical protein
MASMLLSDQERAQRDKLDTLEYPRLLCRADGRQQRVENAADAKKALDEGLTVLPTAASVDDGGTPNHDQVVIVATSPALARAQAQALALAAAPTLAPAVVPEPVPHPAPHVGHHGEPVEDDEDNGKKRRR